MKTNTSLKSLVILVALGVALSCVPAYRASNSTSVGPTAHPELTTMSEANDVVIEWNQQALTLVLLPASALTSVPQVRVMAIVHVAVHDAVNGITRKYDTYLSPGAAPDNASPEAAAIAAAHHTLRNLFQSQAA